VKSIDHTHRARKKYFCEKFLSQKDKALGFQCLRCIAFAPCRLALRGRMAKAFFILCVSEALVAPDALHVIMRHTLPATFAKHQPARFSLLRPEAKTVETGGHILGVRNVIVNEHATVRQWLAWDARTISDFKLAIALPIDASIFCFQSCVLGIALSFGVFR
jgi:hypothetical protein